MTISFSASISHLRQFFVPGLFILCLFPSCTSSNQEIPEPNFDPFVLKPGTYVESKGKVVNMDSMAPPEVVWVKGQWKEAKKLPSKELKGPYETGSEQFKSLDESGRPIYFQKVLSNHYVTGSKPKYFQTAPVPVDMSRFSKPVYTPSVGVKTDIKFPPGIETQLRMESEGNHYIGLLNQQLGLNSDMIDCLLEDRFGRIWIGTWFGGVSIWDGSTLINLTSQEGLPGGTVHEIMEDSNGNIWIGMHSGVIVWNGDEFIAYTVDEGLSDNRIYSLMEDQSGKIWIGTFNGLNMWDGTGFFHYYTEQGLSHNSITEVAEDQHGAIWIGTGSGGVNLWDGEQFLQFTTKQGLSDDRVTKIFEDSKGNVWLGTTDGLNKWDGEGLTYFNQQEGLFEYWIIDVLEDTQGNIWISGNSGVQIYDGTGFSSISDSNGLKFNVVQSLFRDSSGRIWVGTAGGGLHVVTAPTSKHYITDEPLTYGSGYRDLLETSSGDMWTLSRYPGMTSGSSGISSRLLLHMDFNNKLYEDIYGNLLVASSGSLRILNPKDLGENKVPYLQYGIESNISCIMEDRNKNVWLGARKGSSGLYFWDRSDGSNTDSQRFLRYSIDQGLDESGINALLEDQEGRIWAGSSSGISVWDGIKFTVFNKEEGLSNNNVEAMAMDNNGKIWIATRGGGINVWDGQGFWQYTSQQGLLSNRVNSLYADENDNIWAGTHSGLVKLWMETDGRIHYKDLNEYQGIGRSNIVDVLVDGSEKLWTISQREMDIVDLKLQPADTAKPKLTLLGVQPFFDQFDWREVKQNLSKGRNVVTGDRQIPLAKVAYDAVYRFTNLPVDPEFSYNINNLSFQWSSTYWADPTSIRYSYLLEGQDQSWSPLVRENKISYHDLKPGAYTLKVRAVAGSGSWSDTAGYSFTIMPPYWATWWAYTFYGLCAVGLVLGMRHYDRKRFVLKQKAKSLEEIDKIKTEFFTNISHELRTPLTLILGPLKALQEGTFKGDKRSLLNMMSQNGRRLLLLVNQLLDLSKLDQGKLKLAPKACDLNELVQSLVSNFDSAASMKNIDLAFHGGFPIYNKIDIEKIKQVLYNLINNALKFTPEGGSIEVSVSTLDKSELPENNPLGAVKITVRDSGIGIAENELDNIFNRFYQVTNSNQGESEGTGIGLALAQKLVQLHNGTIEVKSEPGWGTTFTMILPVVAAPEEAPAVTQLPKEADSSYAIAPPADLADPTEKVADDSVYMHKAGPARAESNNSNHPILLIVEDNAQMRQYIKSCLEDDYNYLEASNGVEGLKIAEGKLPDLILCDVMMPEMDGYEFCERIREQDATAHIPFIFLTAKADHDSQIKGLEIGSNDYLIKPFDADELRLKIRNHLDRMQQFRSFFGKQLAIKGDIDPVESLDEKFLTKAISVVQDHIDSPEFTVNYFSHEVGMSQPQLYRKLMALTGFAPSAFIRSIRLKKAGQLILQNYGNTSDVAYAIGFNNLSYFAKCFKEQFGVAPSSYGKLSVNR